MIRNLQIQAVQPFLGLNVQDVPDAIEDNEAVLCQNLYWSFKNDGTLNKRLGVSLLQNVSANPTKAMIMFTPSGGTPMLIVAQTNAGGDKLWGGTPGSLSAMSGPALTSNGIWSFVQYGPTLYIFDGKGSVYTSTDGANYAAATLPANLTALGGPIGAFAYYDRMYYFFPRGANGNIVAYSDPYAPLSMTFPQQSLSLGNFSGDSVQGMGFLSWDFATSGPSGSLGIFQNSSFWILSGDPSATQGTTFQQNSANIGLLAPNTLVATPLGAIWVAIDNVYLCNGISNPVPIGDKIFPYIQKLAGSNLWSQMFAVWFDDMYRLYLPDGQGNMIGLWYNTRPHSNMKQGWYGPMTGLPYSGMVADPLQENLYGADQTNGNTYHCEQDLYTDNGTAYNCIFTTKEYIPAGFEWTKRFFGYNLKITGANAGNLSVQVFTDGASQEIDTIPYGSVQSEWDVMTWDVSTWAGTPESLVQQKFMKPLPANSIQLSITQSDAWAFTLERLSIEYNVIRRVQ